MNIREILKQTPQQSDESVHLYITRICELNPDLVFESVRRVYYRATNTKMVVSKTNRDADGNLLSYTEKSVQDRMASFDLPVKRVSTNVGSGQQWIIQEKSNDKVTQESIKPLIEAAVEALNRNPIKLNPSKTFNKRIVFDIITDVHGGMSTENGFLNYDWNSKLLIRGFEENLASLTSAYNQYGRFENLVLMDLGDTLDGYEGLTTRGGHKLDQNMTSDQQFSLVLNAYMSLIEAVLENDITDKLTIHRAENCNHCFTEDVEVLTDKGWKTYSDLHALDQVASKNMDTGEIIFDTPVNYIFNDAVSCDVHEYKNKNIDITVTEEHRMLYKRHRAKKQMESYEYITSKELYKKDTTEISFQVSGVNLKADYNISDNLLRFVAWVITDGSITYNKNKDTAIGFVINQAKEPTKNVIRQLLIDLGIKHRESVVNRCTTEVCGKTLKKPHKALTEFVINTKHTGEDKLAMLLSLINNKKILPKWVSQLSKRQFDVFLNEIILGDGSIKVNTSATISGTKEFLDQLQILCIMNNTKANLLLDNRGDYGLSVVYNKADITFKTKLQLSKKAYYGYTWCLTMPCGNLVVRKNGRVSIQGNSGSFNQILGTTLEAIIKRLYPKANIEFVRQSEFIAYQQYGENTIVTTHGKDKQYMKHGMPLIMNARWEDYLNGIFKRWKILDTNIKVFKGDLHSLGMSGHTFFDYHNMPAFSPPSGWCQHNVGNPKHIGYAIHTFGEQRGSHTTHNHNFDWL